MFVLFTLIMIHFALLYICHALCIFVFLYHKKIHVLYFQKFACLKIQSSEDCFISSLKYPLLSPLNIAYMGIAWHSGLSSPPTLNIYSICKLLLVSLGRRQFSPPTFLLTAPTHKLPLHPLFIG